MRERRSFDFVRSTGEQLAGDDDLPEEISADVERMLAAVRASAQTVYLRFGVVGGRYEFGIYEVVNCQLLILVD